jgi:membrane associated rhomboid family serine protease
VSGSLAPRTERREFPTWVSALITVVCFVALLYVIELADVVSGSRLERDGIRPLSVDGLWGVLWAPLLHDDWAHLVANTGPALVLGFLVALGGLGRFVAATVVIWILGGLGTWLIGDIGVPRAYGLPVSTNHIGASGLIFGWLTFLLVVGFFTRKAWQIVVGVLVFLVYGGILWGALPGTFGVSWQGHLCGGVAGVVAAYLLSRSERAARSGPPPLSAPTFGT